MPNAGSRMPMPEWPKLIADLPYPARLLEKLRMKGPGDCVQSVRQRARGRVQQLVVDTEDAARFCRGQLLPLSLHNKLLQRHAIAGAAPGGEEGVRLRRGNFFPRGDLAGR